MEKSVVENVSEIEFVTKKEFKKKASIHVYGRGSNRRVRLFYDWNNDFDKGRIGYKYMIKGYGVTQAMILVDAYDILINNITDALCWYDTKIAETDEQRFKVPIVG
jgi:hypothetical protein